VSYPSQSLDFSELRRANVKRCLKWHPQGINSWSLSDWFTAMMGEAGELGGELKMLNRERDGLVGNKRPATIENVGKEAADVVIYLDLLCEAAGIDLGEAIRSKFNEVSQRNNFPDRL
jgi:NTP pyrophosphatase (non-canonical NTP hydrolase)